MSQEQPQRIERRYCTRCVYHSDIPAISFDAEGICNYCKLHDEMCVEYPNGPKGWEKLRSIAAIIKREGRRKAYDVVVGVSGGCDSSYMLYLAKELGLRPLAVHFDNTWNSRIATENIHRVLKALQVELYTHVVDNREYDDIYRAFMLAGVPDIEAPTDIGLATTLYLAAEKFGIKYQFDGHNFRTEGVSPLGWLYMDGKYIESVVHKFGHFSDHKLKTFPNLTFLRFLRFMLWSRVRKIRPLYWADFEKEEVKVFLSKTFDWQWYGGHHLENRFTAFYHSYFLPKRFGIDQRPNGFSALIRSGQMNREQAFELLSVPPECPPEIVEMVKKRLGFSEEDFQSVMELPHRTYKEFKTYKPLFERLRPFFYLMYRLDLVPKSFYVKYTAK